MLQLDEVGVLETSKVRQAISREVVVAQVDLPDEAVADLGRLEDALDDGDGPGVTEFVLVNVHLRVAEVDDVQ